MHHAVLTEIDLFEVLPGGDDREHHVAVREVGELVDNLAAGLGERLGLWRASGSRSRRRGPP